MTCWRRELPTFLGERTELYTLGAEYVRALLDVGLAPIIVPEFDEPEAISELLDAVDGLVLTGGEDVHTSTRDRVETMLLQQARRRHLPTLAICRGLQLANVVLGGSLVPDLPATHDHPHDAGDPLSLRHPIRTDAGWLAATFDGPMRVNSIHHQAIQRVAEPLRAVAWAPDHTIEAVEAAEERWYFRGVQWHPEKMTGSADGEHRVRLFEQFAAAVGT